MLDAPRKDAMKISLIKPETLIITVPIETSKED
jgi:hypothetical protein